MRSRIIISAAAIAAVCLSMTACGIKIGSDKDSSSDLSSRRKSDNSIISEILDKGYSATDSGEEYSLDGDFSMLELYGLDSMYSEQWLSRSDDERYAIALNFLNFWAYYGDDASIRFKPSELVSGITDTLEASDISVLDAALDFAVADNKEKYLTLIGVIDIEDITGQDSSQAE